MLRRLTCQPAVPLSESARPGSPWITPGASVWSSDEYGIECALSSTARAMFTPPSRARVAAVVWLAASTMPTAPSTPTRMMKIATITSTSVKARSSERAGNVSRRKLFSVDRERTGSGEGSRRAVAMGRQLALSGTRRGHLSAQEDLLGASALVALALLQSRGDLLPATQAGEGRHYAGCGAEK